MAQKQAPTIASMEQALELIEKRFGLGRVLVAANLYKTVRERVPSGSFALDCAMGGGYAVGYSHMLWGDQSSGKTTTAYRAVAAFQVKYPAKKPIYIASEPFDAENAQANGVDLKKLLVIFPNSGEEAFNVAEILMRSGETSLLVVDSLDLLIPQAELDGSMEDQQRGAQARMINKFLRKLGSVMQPVPDDHGHAQPAHELTAIFVSQMRINQNAGLFGDPRMFGGGKGYGHAMGIIVQFEANTKSATLYEELANGKKRPVGIVIRNECSKNKTYVPKIAAHADYYFKLHRVTKYQLERTFHHGDIDHAKEIKEAAEDVGLLLSSKGGVTYRDVKYSDHSFCSFLDANPGEARTLVRDICRKIEPKLPSATAEYYERILTKRLQRGKDVSPPSRADVARVPVGQTRKSGQAAQARKKS